jgi:hypothetical protein
LHVPRNSSTARAGSSGASQPPTRSSAPRLPQPSWLPASHAWR